MGGGRADCSALQALTAFRSATTVRGIPSRSASSSSMSRHCKILTAEASRAASGGSSSNIDAKTRLLILDHGAVSLLFLYAEKTRRLARTESPVWIMK
jgi:hypothetical protein